MLRPRQAPSLPGPDPSRLVTDRLPIWTPPVQSSMFPRATTFPNVETLLGRMLIYYRNDVSTGHGCLMARKRFILDLLFKYVKIY